MRFIKEMRLLAVAACLQATGVPAVAGQVSVQVVSVGRHVPAASTRRGDQNTVVWLVPLAGAVPAPRPRHYQLLQKDKQFLPRLLVIPIGSYVDFPNQDPFFHNVFSLFNGKRFDLGLYEKGSTRAVRFDHDGVSYIFCNIHPQMHAVVIALSTPYVAVTAGDGVLSIPEVPPGDYRMNVWSEGADLDRLDSLGRQVHVGASATSLGTLRIVRPADGLPHKNKYGEDYPQGEASPY